MRATISLAGSSSFLALSIVVSAAQSGPPPPVFEMRELASASTMRLELRDGADWSRLNVAKLLLRTSSGQRALAPQGLPAGRLISVAAPRGCYMLAVDVGPESEKGHADSWRRVDRCTKTIVCSWSASADPAASEAPAATTAAIAERYAVADAMTAKTSSRIEIRPLQSPTLLRPAYDLPVRLYLNGEAQAAQVVVAIGPRGQEVRATSGPQGIASIRIDSEGRWRLVYRQTDEGAERVAELVFRVESASFWAAADLRGQR